QIPVGKEVLSIDPRYFRPTEVELLVGDATKANKKLGWIQEFVLEDLVREMVQADLKHMLGDKYLKGEGFVTFNYFE
ncbi:MAG TPA: GDP-mannose 4,6-dehydratase, partial [Gillisia sp.]|nr:GDP-mannose 4,6-dehydratase [Gillisia sp.]